MNSGGAIAVIAVALVGAVTWCVQNNVQEKKEERDARDLHNKVKTYLHLEKKQRKTPKENSLFDQLGQDEQVQETIKDSQQYWIDPNAINSDITRLNAQLAKQTSTDQIPLLKEDKDNDNGAEVIEAIQAISSKSDGKIKKQLLQLQRRVQKYQKRA